MRRGGPHGGRGSARSPLRLASDYVALAAGELVAKLAGFAAFAYLARTLGPQAYGTVELAAALAMVFLLLVDFGLGPIGARETARQAGSAPALAGDIPAIRLALALIGAPAMVLCGLLLDLPAAGRLLVVLYATSLLLAPWNLNWLFQGLDLLRLVAPAQAVRMALFAVAVVALVGGARDVWKVGLAELAGAAGMAVYYLLLRRRHLPLAVSRIDLGALRALLVEALPVGLSRVAWALNQYLPTVVVASVVGGAELAWFGAAHRIAIAAGTFVFLYHFNLYPRVVQALEGSPEELEALFRGSFRTVAWLGALAALAGTLLAAPACRLIYGEAFEVAGSSLSLLVWLVPLALLGTHARFALIACGRQKRELVANALGLAALLLSGPPLVRLWGSGGAAAAMLLSSLVAWGAAHLLARPYVAGLPFAGPALKPLAAAGAAFAVALALRAQGPWLPAVAGLALFVAAMPIVEPALRTDLAKLLAGRAGASPGDRA